MGMTPVVAMLQGRAVSTGKASSAKEKLLARGNGNGKAVQIMQLREHTVDKRDAEESAPIRKLHERRISAARHSSKSEEASQKEAQALANAVPEGTSQWRGAIGNCELRMHMPYLSASSPCTGQTPSVIAHFSGCESARSLYLPRERQSDGLSSANTNSGECASQRRKEVRRSARRRDSGTLACEVNGGAVAGTDELIRAYSLSPRRTGSGSPQRRRSLGFSTVLSGVAEGTCRIGARQALQRTG
eukprot:6192497-Pleurochrysis_carterae.AAC.1